MAATGIEIANAYVALTAKFPHIKSDIEEALGSFDPTGSGRKSGDKFSSGFAGAVGGVAASFASKAIDAVTSSLDGAIARVDTMNNFPKIMENLGYSADDAESAIGSMSDRLTGLPTALNTMAGVVQQLAPLTGSLEEATDLSLALNNALLAGGKSTDLQANAMEQYTQMLAVGKVDMAAWRSMVSAMPGQMSQLSEELLGTGKSAFDLYDALQAGELGFDDFNSAILKLNSEGTGAFSSFAQQAQDSTGGIGTAQANLATSITRGLAKVIEELQPVINGTIGALSSLANAVFPVVVAVIAGAKAVFDWVVVNREWLSVLLAVATPIVAVVLALKAAQIATVAWTALTYGAAGASYASGLALKIYTVAMNAQTIASRIAAGAQAAFNAVMSANPIMLVITAIAALVAGLIWFFTQTELGKEIWANFTQFVSEAWANTVQFLTEAFSNIGIFITEALANIASGWESVWTGIGDFLRDMWNNILGWIEGGVNGAIDLINGMMGGLRDVAGFIGIEVGEIPNVNIPRLAQGGVVSKSRGGTLAVIGEGRYDEAVVPLSPQVLAQMGGAGGGGGDTFNVYPTPGMDEYSLAKKTAQIASFERGK